MASACLNPVGLSPETTYSTYSWFNPRHSDLPEVTDPVNKLSDLPEDSDPKDFDGFQFRLNDSSTMLPADELFSDGKLVPLVPTIQMKVKCQETATSSAVTAGETCPDTPFSRRRMTESFAASPRAPRCSSRWKELLGFGKLYQSSTTSNNNASQLDRNNNKRMPLTALASSSNVVNGTGTTSKSIRQFLHRSSKSSSSNDSSVNLPLLKDLDTESISVSSRPSLSSSSSGHEHDDLPRLSLDSDKPNKLSLISNPNTRPKTRMVKTRPETRVALTTTRVGRTSVRRSTDSNTNCATTAAVATDRGLSIDSPRMNSSGKIVFHSLERSSSSPSSLNGGPRFKHRGMERSYSANVRITPVLNVPVCSLRGSSKSGGMFGFPIFSSQQKREGSSNNTNGISNRSQRFNGKSRTTDLGNN